MSRLALDTNAISALFDGDEGLTALLESVERLALPSIVIGEYRVGLQRSRHHKQLEALLDALVDDADVLVVDEGTARSYAVVRERLRARGRPLPENDVWIAALCRQHGVDLVTRDGDFAHVEGLHRVTW
ncbi:MAG: PIN domain-containing protein [Myxococcales bacterium]|nr:PIN domain-containing protein [Myxococcales bacterium]